MDERKKTIAGLETKKQEARLSLALILEDFGEALFGRIQGREELSGSGEEYLGLQREIADSEGFIARIEADTLRLRELEDEIRAKEQERAALVREGAGACVRLGKEALDEPELEVLAGPFQRQIGALAARIDDQEDKLSALEEAAGANVFASIGRNAQGMVLRALLSKNRQGLEKLYGALGEKLVQSGGDSLVSDSGLADTVRDAEGLKERASAAAAELAGLKGERRKIGNAVGAEGGPAKRVQGLEKHIAHVRGGLKQVYRRFGEAASAQGGAGDPVAAILTDGDRPVLEKIELLRATIADYETQIEKLKTAIAIDDERAIIEKLKKGIEDYRERIQIAEIAIAELDGRIAESEKHIVELERRL